MLHLYLHLQLHLEHCAGFVTGIKALVLAAFKRMYLFLFAQMQGINSGLIQARYNQDTGRYKHVCMCLY